MSEPLDCIVCGNPVDYDTTPHQRACCTNCTMSGSTKPGRYFPRDEQADLALDAQPEAVAA